MTKMKPWMKATLAVALVLIVAYGSFSAAMGSFNPKEWSFAGSTNGANPTVPPSTNLNSQQIDMKNRAYNTLDSSASLTDATNYLMEYYRSTGSGYQKLGTATTGTATIETQAADGGFIYATMEPRSGQAYYVDVKTTKANNPRIVASDYFDIDNDGYKEFTFKINVAGLDKPLGANAQCWIYPYFLAYAAPTLASPSDISSIGSAAKVEYIEWYTTFSAVAKAAAVVKVEFAINTTDTTKLSLDNLNIPGVGYLTGDQLAGPVKGTDSLTWTWQVTPYNLNAANYITLGNNQLNKAEFTAKTTCTFTASEVFEVTLTIYTLAQDGTAASALTDTVQLAE